VAYALSPIDLIPDFIPILGYIDDALLLPALIWLTVRLLPPKVVDDSRAKANRWMAMQGRKPSSMLGAPEFDTKRRKPLICIDTPMQRATTEVGSVGLRRVS